MKAIAEYLGEVSLQNGTTDFCVAVSMRGETLYCSDGILSESREGLVHRRHLFDISCISKPLMSAVALKLAERSELDFDAPIARYLPELADARSCSGVAVRHLISHTTGYKGFQYFPPFRPSVGNEAAFTRIRHADSLFWPGTVFNYENSVIALLAEILIRVTGLPVGTLIYEEILKPLGIRVTAAERVQPASRLQRIVSSDSRSLVQFHELLRRPGTSMELTIPDLLTVTESLMSPDASARAKGPCLSDEIVSMLRTQVVDMPRAAGSLAARYLPIGFGMGMAVFRDGYYGCDGISGNTVLGVRYCPQLGVAIALGVNLPSKALRRELLGGIIDRTLPGCVHEEGREAELPVATGRIYDREEVIGQYVGNHSHDVEIRPQRDYLSLVMKRGGRIIMQKRGQIASNGGLLLNSSEPGLDAMFFRYERTNELCLMLGMSALKKVPIAHV